MKNIKNFKLRIFKVTLGNTITIDYLKCVRFFFYHNFLHKKGKDTTLQWACLTAILRRLSTSNL